MKRIDLFKERQVSLKKQINENLALVIGSVVRSPAMMCHSLTTKVDGKTVTRCSSRPNCERFIKEKPAGLWRTGRGHQA